MYATSQKNHAEAKRTAASYLKNGPGNRVATASQADLIFRLDQDTRVTFANKAFCDYLGKKQHNLIGHDFLRFIHEKDSVKFLTLLKSSAKDNSISRIRCRILTSNDVFQWQRWTCRTIVNACSRVAEYYFFSSNHKDLITANKEVSGNGEDYRLLLKRMIHGFALLELCYDEGRVPYDCRFVEANSSFTRIFKKAKQKIIGKTVRETFPGTEYFWIDQCGRIALTGKSIHFENYSKLFGKIFDVVAYSPQKGQFAVVFTEITPGIAQNAILPEDKNNFRALTESMYDGILIAVEKGKPVYANRRLIEITGYSFDELKNGDFKWLAYPQAFEKISGPGRTMMVRESVSPCAETIVIRKNGEMLPIELSTSRIAWYGQPAIIMIFRDIRHRKRHEELLRKQNRVLQKQIEESTVELKQRTAELIGTYEKLKHKNIELLHHKSDLEKANRELVQANTALSVLARNMDKKKDAVEKKIAHTISSQLIPIIEEVKRERIPEKSRVKLDVLNTYLKNLAPGVTKAHDIITSLSSTELRVAIMIKNGFSSADIARLLHLSPHTIKTHRRSIRRKLNIRNSPINLESYLKFKLGKFSNGN